jgi:hypothetical protein
MITTTRKFAAALGCAAALATAATTAALASQPAAQHEPRPTVAAVPNCQPQGLSAGLHGSQAGLGNVGYILTLTNTSNNSCTVDGYPGLGLQNAAHHVLSSTTSWGSTYFDTDPGPSAIVLSPGETASADVAYGAGSGTKSDAVATYLEVTPPNDVPYLTVPIPGAPVRINDGHLFVTAMARHTAYNG